MRSGKRSVWPGVVLVSSLILTAVAPGFAHGHAEERQAAPGGYSAHAAGKEGGAAESSGAIAAWLFGIANFAVALSLLLKACGRMASPGSSFKAAVERLNRRQKRYLMNVHYWLNPLAMGVAIFHFAQAECKSTFVPEFGLIMMILIFMLGLLMTFKLAPASMRKGVFRLHTSPALFVVVLSVLLIGHSMVH